MKKNFFIILVALLMFFAIGCNSAGVKNTKDLKNEIGGLNEVIDLLFKIGELEKEINELKANNPDSEMIKSLEQEISLLHSYIQKIDIRTRPFPEWDSYTAGFSIKDLNYFMATDYEKFTNEYHNHILTVAGNCIKSEKDDDGLETVTFESQGSKIKIKTFYKNGETLSILGKWMQIEFLFTSENGFTLGRFNYRYWPFPENYFKFLNIEKPSDAHYGTIKELLESEQKQVYLEISNERFEEYFIEENNLKEHFDLISFDFDSKKITITLEGNILTQEMFVKLMDVFFPLYSGSALIIRT